MKNPFPKWKRQLHLYNVEVWRSVTEGTEVRVHLCVIKTGDYFPPGLSWRSSWSGGFEHPRPGLEKGQTPRGRSQIGSVTKSWEHKLCTSLRNQQKLPHYWEFSAQFLFPLKNGWSKWWLMFRRRTVFAYRPMFRLRSELKNCQEKYCVWCLPI